MNIATEYWSTFLNFIKILPLAIVEILIGLLVIKLLVFFLRRALKLARVPKGVKGLLVSVVKFGLWVILIIVVSQTLGLGGFAVALTGSAAIAAFFLSASVGPLLANVFAGLFLVTDDDIKVGMKITTNDGKTKGTVKSIDMRKVRIEDDKGLLHIVPNSAVEGTEWIILDRGVKK